LPCVKKFGRSTQKSKILGSRQPTNFQKSEKEVVDPVAKGADSFFKPVCLTDVVAKVRRSDDLSTKILS
jgi:hypothetical protein